ncbi:MAG: hypothetical protein M0Z27_06290, partial [Thermaerobacter sp.]|nr:hypothetical protein [Thermaerobacter sp.]
MADTITPRLTVHLEGPAVDRGEILLEDLAHLSHHLQGALDRIGSGLIQGEGRHPGPLPKKVRRLCSLALHAVRPGSVSLELVLPRDQFL